MLNNNSIIDNVTPLEFYLYQNYPNPFSDKTTIKYCVAYKTRVQIKVYDSEGELIGRLVDEDKQPGAYQVEFHSAAGGGRLPEGDYYYCLIARDYACEKKMVLEN